MTHLALVLVICLVWGFNFIASAAGVAHFPAFLFTVLRFALVLGLLLPWLRRPPAGQGWRLVVVALLNGALHFSLYFMALRHSADISSVAVAMQLYVPFSVLIAVCLLGERIGWRSALAIVIAFIGVLVVGFDPLVFTQLDALALTIASAFCLGLGSVLMRGLAGIGVMNFQAWSALISLPVLLAMSMAFEQDHWALVRTAGWVPWSAALYSAVGGSIIGHGLFYYLVQRRPVAEVTPYLLLTPVLGVAFAILFWGDQPGWRLYAGAALVLGGVLGLSLRLRSKYRARTAPV